MKHKKNLTFTLIGFLFSGAVSAALIPVASVTPSSTFYTYNVQNLINGAGLTSGFHSGAYQGKWMTDTTSTGTLVFDFGSVFSVDNTQIWNYGTGCCGTERSTKDMVIESSIDGINYDIIGLYVLSQPITDPFGSDTIGLGGLNARFIKFELNSAYGPTDYIGLSEVHFFGSESNGVPEPATLALMGLGLAGLGAMRRRKS